jgi:ATP-dependent helicase/nuclease subunit B
MLRAGLARHGCPLLNLEALTPEELAFHIVRTMRPDDRRRTIRSAEGAFRIRRLCERLDLETGPLLKRSAFRVHAAVEELRASGVEPDEVRAAAERGHERDLASLLSAWETHLRNEHLRDRADVLRTAVDAATEFAERRVPELVAILDRVRVTDVEKSIIRRVAGGAGRVQRVGVLGIAWPRDRAVHVLSDWPGPDARPEPDSSGMDSVQTIVATERREEIRSVLSDIVERGIPFSDVEVAFTSAEPYRAELRAACSRYRVPLAETGPGVITETRLGAAVRAALRWAADGYASSHLIGLLRGGYLRVSRQRSVEIASVLDRFPVSFAASARPDVRKRLKERAREEHVKSEILDDAFDLMDALRRLVPAGGEDPASGIYRFVDGFIREMAPPEAGDDRSASDRGGAVRGAATPDDETASGIRRELEFLETGAIGPSSGASTGRDSQPAFADVPAAAAFALQILERTSGNRRENTGGLAVTPLEDAGFGRVEHVYVVGLDDQASAAGRLPDSLLTDAFRSRLRERTGRGPLVDERTAVDILIADVTARHPGRVTLCRSLYDVAEDRPLFPGPGFARVSAHGTAGRSKDTRGIMLDLTDEVLARASSTPAEFAGLLFEHVEAGLRAAEARRSTEWSAFDGVVPVRPHMLPGSHSPSALEDLAACPYRYFLKYILEVRPQESQDPDEWMTVRDRGQLLHTLFERHALRRMDGKADLGDGDVAWMADEASRLLDRFSASNPPPHEGIREEAHRAIVSVASVYLHSERENEDRKPHAAEFRFSSGNHADAPAVAFPMEDGEDMLLTGRVDRIDVDDDGRLVVTDFKTGSRRGLRDSDLRKLDLTLQWAIYAWMVGRHFDRSVSTSGYLFTSERELGLRREAAPPPADALRAVLASMTRQMNAGFFARNANPNGDPCRFCDYRPVCGDLRRRRDEMRAKACRSVQDEDEFASIIEDWNGFSRRYCS